MWVDSLLDDDEPKSSRAPAAAAGPPAGGASRPPPGLSRQQAESARQTAAAAPAAPAASAAPAEDGDLDPEVSRFLADNGLSKYGETLRENEIDYDSLLMLEQGDLQDMGISKKGPLIKFAQAIATAKSGGLQIGNTTANDLLGMGNW